MNYVSLLLPQIIMLCQQYSVNRLYVFGSVLTDRFNEQSDIDLIVNFDRQKISDYFSNFFDFKYALEDVFNRKVDLLEEKPIQNKYLKESIDNSKQLIYGQD